MNTRCTLSDLTPTSFNAHVDVSKKFCKALLIIQQKMMMENKSQGTFLIELTFSRESAVHMSRFRVRCNKCHKNFCANC